MNGDEECIRVLIVDDEDSYRLPLKERLSKFLKECVLEDVTNGDEARQAAAARNGGYDVALIDQVLSPPPDGIEVMRELKETCPYIQVIMLTGWELDAGLEALRAGAYRYISKSSLNVEELALMIQMAAEHRRLKKRGWQAKVLETSSALLSSLELGEVLGKILNGIKEIGYDRVRLYLLSEDRQMLIGKMQAGGPEGFEAVSLLLAEDPYSRTTLHVNAPRIYQKGELGPDQQEKTLYKEDVAEWIEIPLIARDGPVGKITIDNKFSHKKLFLDELEPLAVFANHAANAIYNARLFEQNKRDLANLSRLFDASSRIASTLDLDETLELITHNAVTASRGCSATLCLIDENGQPAIRTSVEYDEETLRRTAVRPDGISMEVIHTTKQPFPIPDIGKIADIVNPGMIEAGFKAAICLPLLSKGRAIGVMWVNYLETHPFSQEEIKLLQTFANQAAIAIENARLYKETEHRVEELALLNQVGQTLASGLELEQVPKTIMQQVGEALDVEAGSVMLLDEKTGELIVEAAVGPSAEKLQGLRFPSGQGIAGWVARQGQPLLVPNAREDSRFYAGIDETTGFVTQSLLAIPMQITGKVVGVIEVVNKTKGDFSQTDLGLLLAMAPAASIAVENARLYAKARRSAQELSQQMHRLAAVQRACTAISSSLSLNTILGVTCKQVVELFGIDHSGLAIFDENNEYGLVVAEYPNRDAVGGKIQIRGVSLEEQLIESKRPVIVRNVADEPLLGPVRDTLLNLGIRSILIAPLVVKDRVIGSFSLDVVGSKHNFTAEEVDLCQIISAQAAVAIDNANLLTKQEHNLTVLQTMYTVLSDLRTTLDAESVLDSIANFLRHIFDLATCTIGLIDETREYLEFKIHKGLDKPVKRRIKGLPQDLWEDLWQVKKCVEMDLTARPDLAQQLERKDLKSFAALPLQGREKLLGILTMSSTRELSLTKEDWDLIKGLADQAALAIENTNLFKLEQERARRWQMVANAGGKLAYSLASPPRELLEIIARAACEIIGADCAVIYPYYADTMAFDTEHYAGFGLWKKDFPLSGKKRESPGWAGQIIDIGRITVNDITEEAKEQVVERTRFVQEEGVKAFVGLRLDAAGGPVGILYVNFRSPHRWTDDELEAIQPFANQAALTIQHALFLRKRSTALQGIIDADQIITSTLELRIVLERIVSTAMNTLQADAITLHPYDQAKGEFWPEFVHQGLQRSDEPGWSPRSSKAAERVVASGKPHFSDDTLSHEILRSDFAKREKIVAAAGLPLKVGRDVLGVVFVNYREPHHFTSDEQDIIQMFANDAAIAIYNASLFEQTKKGQRRLQTAINISKAFSSSLELDQVIDTLLSSLAEPFPQAHNRTVELYEPNARRLVIHPASYKYYYQSEQESRQFHKSIPLSKSIGGWAVTHKRPINVANIGEDNRYLPLIPKTRSQLTVPIMFGNDVIGVLTLESDELAAFDGEDQRLLEALADQAGVAIENARRYQRLEEAQETLKARTAIAWVGMAVSAWFHRVRGSAAAVKDYTLLIREKLSDVNSIAPVSEDLQSIDVEVEKLLEISMRGGLPTKDDLELVHINQFLRGVVGELCKSHKNVVPIWQFHIGDEVATTANSRWLAVGIEMLVANALRAMIDEGKLTIRVSKRAGRIYIRVIDTGPGIPEPLRERLFKQPLTHEEGVRGSGMGLLMTKMILDAYKGDINMEKTGEKGTTFVISLPEANSQAQ